MAGSEGLGVDPGGRDAVGRRRGRPRLRDIHRRQPERLPWTSSKSTPWYRNRTQGKEGVDGGRLDSSESEGAAATAWSFRRRFFLRCRRWLEELSLPPPEALSATIKDQSAFVLCHALSLLLQDYTIALNRAFSPSEERRTGRRGGRAWLRVGGGSAGTAKASFPSSARDTTKGSRGGDEGSEAGPSMLASGPRCGNLK